MATPKVTSSPEPEIVKLNNDGGAGGNPSLPALRVSQVTVVVGLIDQYDAPQHFLDEQGQVRQFQFFGDENGTSLEKAAGFLAAVPHMLASQPEPAAD